MMGIASIRSIPMFTVFKPKIRRNLGLVFGEDQGDPYLPDEYVFSFGVTKTDQPIYPHALNCSCKSGSSYL